MISHCIKEHADGSAEYTLIAGPEDAKVRWLLERGILALQDAAEDLEPVPEPMKAGWHGPDYDFGLFRPWPDDEDPDDTWLRLEMKNIPKRVRSHLYEVVHSAVGAAVANFSAGKQIGLEEGAKKAEEADDG